MRFIDPDGRAPMPPDDHFNQFGKYLYTDNKKTNNIIIHFQNPFNGKLNTAPWLTKELKDYRFDENNLDVLANIMNHYAKDAKIDLKNIYGNSTSVALYEYTRVANNLTRGKIFTYNDGEFKKDALATGIYESKKITFMVENNYVSPLLNDKNNVISALEHEGGSEVSHLTLPPTYKNHKKIYENQFKSPYFKNATKDFQDQMKRNYNE